MDKLKYYVDKNYYDFGTIFNAIKQNTSMHSSLEYILFYIFHNNSRYYKN